MYHRRTWTECLLSLCLIFMWFFIVDGAGTGQTCRPTVWFGIWTGFVDQLCRPTMQTDCANQPCKLTVWSNYMGVILYTIFFRTRPGFIFRAPCIRAACRQTQHGGQDNHGQHASEASGYNTLLIKQFHKTLTSSLPDSSHQVSVTSAIPGALGVVLGMGGSGSAGRQPWKRPGVPRAVGRSPHKKPDKKPGGKR